MKMKKGAALLLVSAAMVSLAGCGGNSGGSGSNASNAAGGSSELPTLRVAAMPTITSLPTYYIQKNGLDEKAGFKMEVTMFDTGAPMNEALAADLWDVGQMGAAAVTGMANYDELIIGEVLESTDGQGVFVSPDCPVAQDTGFNPSIPTVLGSPESVSGITILTPVGTAQHFTVLKWLEKLGMEDKLEGRRELIAGINHMGWLLELHDKDGNGLYPEIRRRAAEKNATEKHDDMVRFEYIKHLGYYCTESSEHNAEYNPLFIKSRYPEMIEKYNIPLDEYPRRCVEQIKGWEKEREDILKDGKVTHERSKEYASYIMEAVVTGNPYKIGGNVLNTGLIDNLPSDACVEVPCMVDANGINPCHVGRLPVQLAAMNMTNINVQLLTIEAAATRSKEKIYQAAMLEPHTAAELNIDDIKAMCDELIEAHGDYMSMYK